MESAQDHNLKVLPWTVEKKDKMKKLKTNFSIDGIITDYPDRLEEVVD